MEFVEQLPAATGVATTLFNGTVPLLCAAASNGYNRIAVTLQADGRTIVGVASNMTASAGAIADVPSGSLFEERDYKGDLYVKAEAATLVIRSWETRF